MGLPGSVGPTSGALPATAQGFRAKMCCPTLSLTSHIASRFTTCLSLLQYFFRATGCDVAQGICTISLMDLVFLE